MSEFNVTLPSITKEFQMEVIFASTDYNSIRLTVEDVARPGLTLSGYFDHFEPRRLQVLGNMEWSYLHKKTPQERLVIFDRLFDYKIPAAVCRWTKSAWPWRKSTILPSSAPANPPAASAPP